MEIKIDKSELLNAVNTVSKSVPSRSSMPILSCILITVSNGEISFTSNDTEMATVYFGDNVEIIEDGLIAVESDLFCPIVSKLPQGEVSIKVEEEMLIKCGRSKFSIPVRSGEEYPAVENVPRENSISLSQREMKDIIRQTIFCADMGSSNKTMTGELFEIKDGKLKVVALDGHRIAVREKELNTDYETSVIIPAKSLLNISRIMGEGDLNVYFTDNMVAFHFGNTLVTSRLIEGDYFDIDRMFGAEPTTIITVKNDELSGCLDRASLLIDANDKKPIIFTIGDKLETKLQSRKGEMTETIEIEKQGENLMIGFNPSLMLDALKAVEDEEVKFSFTNNKAPCYIEGEGYCYLILPVNFQGA